MPRDPDTDRDGLTDGWETTTDLENNEYGATDPLNRDSDFNEAIDGGAPEDIVKEKGLLKVEGDIVETAAQEAIAENPQSVDDYRAGKEKALNALVGAVMKKTRGRADAKATREILLAKLG